MQAEPVEGADTQAFALCGGEHAAHAGIHLARRLVGKGNRGDMPRLHLQFFDQAHYFACNHQGFAAARAG